MGLMSTSIKPPPAAYTADAINSPAAGEGRTSGRKASSTSPAPQNTCAATAQGR